MDLKREYPHLVFSEHWDIGERNYFVLGQCEAFVKAIKKSPIQPEYYQKLMGVTLIKGAQATTAIEGNTLTIEEIQKVSKGEKLPPSKEYQEQEVNNILEAFVTLLEEAVKDGQTQLITPSLLLRFHKMVGKDLGEFFEAVPGRFRERDVFVGTYRCPDYRDVVPLIEKFCQWQRQHFKYEDGNQKFSDIIIQAIVAHVYLELIHPFPDGNGRTGRLLEFYVLLRGGMPNITLQILSNHYNNTRPEYYKQISKVSETRSLTEFIRYALTGLRDGLQETLQVIQESLTDLTWKNYIYNQFAHASGQKDVIKRKRTLALKFPMDGAYVPAEVLKLDVEIALSYAALKPITIQKHLDELVVLNILKKVGNKYTSNKTILNDHLPIYKGMKFS